MPLPPLPPSPPAGPPKGRYFSRRNAMAPSPPLPACTKTRASSMNRMIELYLMAFGARSKHAHRENQASVSRPRSKQPSGLRDRTDAGPRQPATRGQMMIVDGVVFLNRHRAAQHLELTASRAQVH